MGKRMAKTRKESDVWKIVNRERKKKRRLEERIDEKVWKKCFMGLRRGGI